MWFSMCLKRGLHSEVPTSWNVNSQYNWKRLCHFPFLLQAVLQQYLYLSFGHNLVCHLSVLFVLLGFVAALLIAEQPERLRALQLDLKLLPCRREHRVFVSVRSACHNVLFAFICSPIVLIWVLTSFQLGSVESLCTRVLALLTK